MHLLIHINDVSFKIFHTLLDKGFGHMMWSKDDLKNKDVESINSIGVKLAYCIGTPPGVFTTFHRYSHFTFSSDHETHFILAYVSRLHHVVLDWTKIITDATNLFFSHNQYSQLDR